MSRPCDRKQFQFAHRVRYNNGPSRGCNSCEPPVMQVTQWRFPDPGTRLAKTQIVARPAVRVAVAAEQEVALDDLP
jgi:hypothetical protein